MECTVNTLANFYKTPLGEIVRVYVTDIIEKFLSPYPKNEYILGLGYVTPFLPKRLLCDNMVMSFTFNHMGGVTWPNVNHSMTAIVESTILPIPTQSIDRLIMVHGLEFSDHPIMCLKEIQRIMQPDGHILIIFPNKNGLWSHSPGTPFAFGEHFTSYELSTYLEAHQFQILYEERFLYFPPLQTLYTHTFLTPMELFGSQFLPFFSGLNGLCARKTTVSLPNCHKGSPSPVFLKPIKAYDHTS